MKHAPLPRPVTADPASRIADARAFAEIAVRRNPRANTIQVAADIEEIARRLNGGPVVRLGPGLGDPS